MNEPAREMSNEKLLGAYRIAPALWLYAEIKRRLDLVAALTAKCDELRARNEGAFEELLSEMKTTAGLYREVAALKADKERLLQDIKKVWDISEEATWDIVDIRDILRAAIDAANQ